MHLCPERDINLLRQKNQTTVFCTFLDASKAFDRINYCNLFRLLINRDMHAYVTRVLLNLYIGNFVRISWCGILSDYFLATDGVKQGRVLSPVLFCMNIDGLLTALASANVGCYIGRNYVGALAYADDLVLTVPSACALRKMLAICNNYASDFHMSFNDNKSKCIVIFPSSRACLRPLLSDCNFKIGEKVIEFVLFYSHLGHVVTDSMDDGPDISKRHGDFIGQVNSVLCDFRQLPSIVKYRSFSSYCTSFYGSELSNAKLVNFGIT